MKAKVKIGLIFCMLIVFNGCATKDETHKLAEEKGLMIVEGVSTMSYTKGIVISPKDLTICPDKKIIEEVNRMKKIDVIIDESTNIIPADVGDSFKIVGCIKKDEKSKETIDLKIEFKYGYIY